MNLLKDMSEKVELSVKQTEWAEIREQSLRTDYKPVLNPETMKKSEQQTQLVQELLW